MSRALLLVPAVVTALVVGSLAIGQEVEGLSYGAEQRQFRGDVDEWSLTGGVAYADPIARLSIRCDRAMVVLDRSEGDALIGTLGGRKDLPRRGPPLPASRRAVDNEVIRQRIGSLLGSLQARPLSGQSAPFDIELFRAIYLEGDVSLVLDDVEVLHAASVWFSPVDDRAVFTDPVLRLRQKTAFGQDIQITVRATEIARQHGRFVGRDVSLTTSKAGEPQFDVISSDVEIRERPNEFEVYARDNEFRVHGRAVLPLPDQHFYTADQDQMLIKGASAGYSERLGAQARIVWGSTFNDVGGAFHEWVTGRPADEFRGDWRLETSWLEKRGFPVKGDFTYRGGDLWYGRTIAFGIDDDLAPIGPIRRELDGTAIGPDGRALVRTENRIQFTDRTDLDLSLFWANDPSIYPEFYRGEYYRDERPETSALLRHRGDNWLATLGARGNLNDYSYADGRQLAPGFAEEMPSATLDLFSVPLFEIVDDTPLLFTSSTGTGRLRTDWDPGFAMPVDDETWRFDQEFELAVPARIGVLTARPFATGRYTGYERTMIGGSHGRFAFSTGAEIGTELARTYDFGDGSKWRHELLPTIRYENRFAVQREPGDFFQQDGVDALDERSRVRIGLLQRLLSKQSDGANDPDVREEVWLDLAQNFAPNADRDNNGDVLELFEFELLLRSIQLTDDVSLGILIEAEQDWNTDELRTFNAFTELRTGQFRWMLQYRSDEIEKGVVGYGLSLPLRSRWQIDLRGAYDIERGSSAYYLANLIRNELDWRLFFGLTYDVVTDDTTFHLDFEPRLGGIVRQHTNWSVGGYEFGRGGVLDY